MPLNPKLLRIKAEFEAEEKPIPIPKKSEPEEEFKISSQSTEEIPWVTTIKVSISAVLERNQHPDRYNGKDVKGTPRDPLKEDRSMWAESDGLNIGDEPVLGKMQAFMMFYEAPQSKVKPYLPVFNNYPLIPDTKKGSLIYAKKTSTVAVPVQVRIDCATLGFLWLDTPIRENVQEGSPTISPPLQGQI